MSEQVADLAARIRLQQKAGEKFVLLLGAGASLASKVCPTQEIMKRLLAEYGSSIRGASLEERFEALWQDNTTDDQRERLLAPFLERHDPSPGYGHLAELVGGGLFDEVITFNFDTLLEQALTANDIRHRVVIRGDHDDKKIGVLMGNPDPRVRILKLHGSLRSGQTFLFSLDEMDEYPELVRKVVERLTARHILVCGYAFNDQCVVNSFSREGGQIYCVDPAGTPRNLIPKLRRRRSQGNVIRLRFDEFFEELSRQLKNGKRPPYGVKRVNPFKYLDGYGRQDCKWFLGRDGLTRTVLGHVDNPAIRVVCLHGARKVGKSSFVKAGLMGHLEAARTESIYLRCRRDLAGLFANVVRRRVGVDEEEVPLARSLELLAEAAAENDKRLVIVLDNFEAVLAGESEAGAGDAEQVELLRALYHCPAENVTLVLVVPTETSFWRLLVQVRPPVGGDEQVEVPALSSEEMIAVVRDLVKKANLRLDEDVFQELQRLYAAEDAGSRPFTLAHVQAICYLMAQKGLADLDSFLDQLDDQRETLDRAINDCDVMRFFEDFPVRTERMMMHSLMKIVSRRSRTLIAEQAEKLRAEDLRDVPFPEPIEV